MTKDEAIALIVDQLSYLQLRTQGSMDWQGEIDVGEMAEEIFDTVRRAESD